ncbi:MAG: cobalamin-binding protein [Gammaproteobacteria bacterium]|jgi:iron complex transport system substrate-binding protein|nr:cobalamin-binding protein [Chromatiales bacterium]MCP4926487.1 cobalamin-binding protein [Gammaproteobacteria bacterium]MDP7419819.1 cobalamin-binding protein [Gammaproteobacteria bacterium]
MANRHAHFPPFRYWLLSAIVILLLSACDNDRLQNPVDAPNRPSSRIITLAPHLTELVYSAGAGNRLVGVVEYSDYPAVALNLPRIGDAFRLDHEAIIGLKPDLILAWESGTPRAVIDRLEQLDYRVVVLAAGSLDGVAESLRAIGRLAGTQKAAEAAALAFEISLDEIRMTTAGRESLTVFYQVSSQPLFTISRQHIIGEAIELCGGHNVFAGLPEVSPSISPEAVIDAAPEVIIATQFSEDTSMANALAVWQQWTSIPAVHDSNLYFVDASLMTRPSVRILGGVRELCARISTAREKKVSTTAHSVAHDD